MVDKSRFLTGILLTIAAIIICFTVYLGESGAVQTGITRHGIKADNNLMQFKAGNIIIGFTPNKAYLAGIDHALSVEFLGAKGVMPKSDKPVSPDKTGKALPMGKVKYENLWEGISLVYEATKEGNVETTYCVAPKADVSKIKLKYNAPVELRKDGKLKIKFGKGYMTESAPIAWQEIEGKKKPVEVAFRVEKGEIGFRVGKYDPKYALIIDPTYEWHTFYGSASSDNVFGITTDKSDNIYVIGFSYESWNGPGGIPPKNAFKCCNDIFILKLNSNGEYLWHTFFGGDGWDLGHGIAVSIDGYVYITGYSLVEWSGPGGEVPKHAHSGNGIINGKFDMFILKLDNNGQYQWHTFYAGWTNGVLNGIAVDRSGNAYVTGASDQTWNGPGDAAPLNEYSGGDDITVLKLDSDGEYKWHAFYGGSYSNIVLGDGDYGERAAIDENGNVYVVGYSHENWLGPEDAAPKHAHAGNGFPDVLVLKLNSSGEYQWHTFYGGSSNDMGHGIALYGNDNVYIVGYSDETWNGPEGQTPKHKHGDAGNIVAIGLNSNGEYQWHTFYGNSGPSIARDISVDSDGSLYLTGYSEATWNGPGGEIPDHAYTGDKDIFVLKLNGRGEYQWHTFYGGIAEDIGLGMAVTRDGNIFVAGRSQTTWNGSDDATPLHDYNGDYDSFVLMLTRSCPASPAKIESGSVYGSFAEAYTNAISGNSILAQAGAFDTALNLNREISVSLKGGYFECDFSSNGGYTTVPGLTVSAGTVSVDKVILK